MSRLLYPARAPASPKSRKRKLDEVQSSREPSYPSNSNDHPQPNKKNRKGGSIWSSFTSWCRWYLSFMLPSLVETATPPAPPSSSTSHTDGGQPSSDAEPTQTANSTGFRDRVHASLRNHSGYVLGGGDVYGGEYTVYKDGDPSTTHSIGTVRCSGSALCSVKEILAFSRVQNQVAKTSIVAFPDADEGVRYLCFNFRAVASR